MQTDGHSYEREALAHWLSMHRTSPPTGSELANVNFVPNHALRNAIDDFKAYL